jgi:hypothetical protein
MACLGFCVLAAEIFVAVCHSEELLAPDVPVQHSIDHYVDHGLRRAGVVPAPVVDDANFLRRVMLDLVGRPPSAPEVKAFLASTDPDKRSQAVDRLMDSPAFVRQQATEFDAWLMDGTKASIRDYLVKAFREQRSWEQMFRDMVVGEPDDPKQQGAIRYVASRARDPDRMTSDASVMFFGVNVSCAKCHDHPLVPDWTQDHYYGMLSFFSRTFDAGGLLGERDYGRVNYKTVKGESRDAKLLFLTGLMVDEPATPEPDENAKKAERKLLEELKQKKEPPPPPSFSRRGALVDTALRDEEQLFFARAIVNHVWNQFFGRGLVMPIDQMHAENPPSHPELLAWLARDMRSSSYSLRRLVRGIVLSQAYARSSRWESSDKRPADALFAVAQVRPLKPWQYGTLLKQAARGSDRDPGKVSTEDSDRQLEELESAGRNLGANFDLPQDDFQVGVEEALLLTNSDKVAKDLLSDGPETLIGRMALCSNSDQAAELAIWSVFGRPPAADEVRILASYLDERADRIAEARKQLVWALLTSSECRFNY